MMFDTLVQSREEHEWEEGFEDDLDDLKELFPRSYEAPNQTTARKRSKAEQLDTETIEKDTKKDPILGFLQSHYSKVACKDLFDSSSDCPDTGDLSWDEGDLPQLEEHQVWSFNDFMEQYNQLYSWLNQLQEKYHLSKKSESSTPRLAGIRRELESSSARREWFLSSCGRMVTSFPDLGEEVGWRVEHVLAKWDMLTNLKANSATNMEDVSYIYSDIECDVRCLRKWLKEMEYRIDPLQFHAAATWSTKDIEKKMAEYQVLQKDIESHGKIVKMVLTLCEELSVNPGLYDLHHALKVAKNLERRWHQIWLRSLEWQCLLEQWIQDKTHDLSDITENGFETEEEPLTKIPKLSKSCFTPNISPAATLLRRKKRKRWIKSPLSQQITVEKKEDNLKDRKSIISPHAKRKILQKDTTTTMENSLSHVNKNDVDCLKNETNLSSKINTNYIDCLKNNTNISSKINKNDVDCLKNDTNLYSKMATSESELSVSGKSTTRSQESPNCGSFYFQHISDEEGYSKMNTYHQDTANDNNDIASSNAPSKTYYSETVDNDAFGHSIIRSKEDIHLLANRAELMALNGAANICETIDDENFNLWTSDDESDEGTVKKTLGMVSNQLKQHYSEVSPKERKKFRQTNSKRFSTIESERNIPLLDIQSLLTEGARAQELEEAFRGNQNYDGLSSEEIGGLSARSFAISDCWDQEMCLSERNYDEPLDEETAIKLINFGDDYRNFIESESDFSLQESLVKPTRKISKRKRKKTVVHEVGQESQSENEFEDICNLISDSHKKMNNIDVQVSNFVKDGFIKQDDICHYNELLQTCSHALSHLLQLLQSIEQDDSFVSKKKGREIRFLLQRWELLSSKIKNRMSQAETYTSLSSEITTYKKELEEQTQSTQKIITADNSMDLQTKLHMFKDAIMELSKCKSRLFQLSISVHNFLADLNSSESPDQEQVNLVQNLKKEVDHLNESWENCHHQTSGYLSDTEGALNKLAEFQQELVQLRNVLRHDAISLSEKNRRKISSKSGKKGNNSSGDSGISDSSGGSFSDYDMPQREQHLNKLKIMAKDLEQSLSQNSPALAMISQTLETTSCQLKDLQKDYHKYKTTKNRTKYKTKLGHEKLRKKETSCSRSRRGRVVKMALMINILLMFVVFLSWLSQPRCCDSYNVMLFSPQLTYINGPPPI